MAAGKRSLHKKRFYAQTAHDGDFVGRARTPERRGGELFACLEIIARGLDQAVARLKLHVEDT
jgi:hypothetical protein